MKTIFILQVDILEVIKDKMQEQELKNKDIAPIIGSKGHVSSILSGEKRDNLKNGTTTQRFFQHTSRIIFTSLILNART
ncbi:hypothetical protein [Niabella aquatica]